jgi:hypothetical protein
MSDRRILLSLAIVPIVLALAMDATAPAPSRRSIRDKENFGPAQCDLPEVPLGARYVDFRAERGEALSSATLATQDIETTTVDVTIERGRDPLFVVLISSGPLIWRVSGAVNRVAHLVVSSERGAPPTAGDLNGLAPDYISKQETQGNLIAYSEPLYKFEPLSGVVGLQKAKVTIAKSGCPGDYYEKLGFGGEYVKESFSASSILRVSLPSGVLIKAQQPRSSREVAEGRREPAPPAGFDAKAWREAVNSWPAVSSAWTREASSPLFRLRPTSCCRARWGYPN